MMNTLLCQLPHPQEAVHLTLKQQYSAHLFKKEVLIHDMVPMVQHWILFTFDNLHVNRL